MTMTYFDPVSGRDLGLSGIGGALVIAHSLAIISAGITRPADTAAYTALDTVSTTTAGGTVIQFANIGRVNSASGFIKKARIATDQTTCIARFRLHLFSASPIAIADNAPFADLWAQRTSKMGAIDFAACATEGTGSTVASSLNTTVNLAFDCMPTDTNLYGLLETLDTFTPTSAQNFYIELTADQN